MSIAACQCRCCLGRMELNEGNFSQNFIKIADLTREDRDKTSEAISEIKKLKSLLWNVLPHLEGRLKRNVLWSKGQGNRVRMTILQKNVDHIKELLKDYPVKRSI